VSCRTRGGGGGRDPAVGPLAQRRQHIGGELLEEAPLVAARAVDDEVVEAEVEVGPDAVDDIGRVVGDDEAGVRLVRAAM
jgi:hypothetical protein